MLKLLHAELNCGNCQHWFKLDPTSLGPETPGECRGMPPQTQMIGPGQQLIVKRVLPRSYPICSIFEAQNES
jgi:hypothetical protein